MLLDSHLTTVMHILCQLAVMSITLRDFIIMDKYCYAKCGFYCSDVS